MKAFFQRMLNKSRSMSEKMDKYQHSLAFAEAGASDPAAGAAASEQVEEQPGVLLVIGNGDSFSQRIIDYAIEMAERMAYRIVALNIAPVPEETFRFFSPPRNQMEEFEEIAAQNALLFKKAAEEHGLSFTHIVRFGETDSVIESLRKEYGEIDFVVSEPREEQAADRPENENRAATQLYVYSMV